MKKFCSRVLAAVIGVSLLLGSSPVYASGVENGAIYPIATNEMEGWPQGPALYAETAVLMEAETGAILYDKGMDKRRYPASITKIMTALVAVEHTGMDEEVVFTEECLEAQASDSTNIGMQVGEKLTMKQCLMALMIQSANDVATQIAVHVSGSVQEFANLMNQRARELGCTDTNFVNANGLPDENHYTTAHDMALIFRQAIKSDVFREVISTLSYTIEPTNMNPESRKYTTHHALLAPTAPEYYEGCIGGKTGNTQASRCTLVTGAERNGMTLIAVAMRADAGQVAQDHISLFNYGFDNFKKAEVPGGSVVLPKDQELKEMKIVETGNGEAAGQTYYYRNTQHLIGTGSKEESPETVLDPELSAEDPAAGDDGAKPADGLKKRTVQEQFYRYVLYLLGILIILGLLTIAVRSKNRRRRRKMRRKKNGKKRKNVRNKNR